PFSFRGFRKMSGRDFPYLIVTGRTEISFSFCDDNDVFLYPWSFGATFMFSDSTVRRHKKRPKTLWPKDLRHIK
ncbi:MAG: hypothetical protein WA131_05600, partial [Desulfitobacteriaceae bacterium]